MKIFILTEGGENIGFGHIARCVSFAQAFSEKGIEVNFIVNSDESVVDLLKGNKYKLCDWIKEKESLAGLISKEDIVIIDSYFADKSLYDELSSITGSLVCLDDNNRLDYPDSIVLNGAMGAEKMKYKNEKTSYLLGVNYFPMRSNFWDIEEKKINDKIESLMVTFGGDDKRSMTGVVMKMLEKNFPKFHKKVLVGKSFKDSEKLKALKSANTELIYHPTVDKMKEVMVNSDIAISACGQTLYELARIGLPTVGICIAENQAQNIKGWEDAGFLEYVGWYDGKDLENNLNKAMLKLESKSEREKRSKIGRNCVDGQGARKVVSRILEIHEGKNEKQKA